MSDLTLTLGDITFTGFEVPQRIPFGGDQMLVTHKLVGGQRTVDAMGPDEAPIEWSGWIIGQNAVARAQSIDAMRISGIPQRLTWNGFDYQVVVRSFKPVFERFYQIPYSIVLEVIANNTQPVTTSATPPIDEAVSDDNTTADGLVTQVSDPPLSGLMALVDTAIAAVTVSTAALSVISGIRQAIQNVVVRVVVLIEVVEIAIGTPTTFGGVTAGIPPQSSVNALLAAGANTMRLFNLLQLQAVLGRLSANLGSVDASASVVNTAGGNLFQISQDEYGDATDWPAIAAANGLTDPFIQGSETLTIPPQPGSTGGILSA